MLHAAAPLGSPEDDAQEGVRVPSTISPKTYWHPRETETEVTPHEESGDMHSGPGLSLNRWETHGRPLKLTEWPSAFSSLVLDGGTGWKLQVD